MDAFFLIGDVMVTYFRWVGWFEGVSLLVLLFIAMPLKYIWMEPQMVRTVGSIHGFLFLAYVFTAFGLYEKQNWSKKKLILAIILSSVPFGTFIFEKKFLGSL